MTLWEYLNKEHGLSLLDSEIHDILELARKEIEIPDEGDLYVNAPEQDSVAGERDALIWIEGAIWALHKVRNPYPKSIRFKEDPDEFFKK